MDANEPNRPPKRKRLNFACNYCRARKVRCDQQEPSCRGCLAAGVECTTTDKRRPGLEVRRRPAGTQDPGPQPPPPPRPPGPNGGTSSRQVELLPATARPAHSSALPRGTVPAVPMTPASASEPGTTNRSPSLAAPTPDNVATTLNPRSTTTTHAADIDPDTPGQRFAGRLPMAPRISGGDTLEIMTGWLELAFHRLGIPASRFDSCLRRRSTNALSSSLPPGFGLTPGGIGVPLALPRIPPAERCRAALSRYYATVHVLYPVLERDVLDRVCEDVLGSCAAAAGGMPMVPGERLPEFLMFCLALVLGIAGTDPAAGDSKTADDDDAQLVTSCVGFCETMLGHVLGWGTVDAVRVIFLLALALRWREKITSAWPLAGVCVSLAQVLGLDRQKHHGRRSPSGAGIGVSGEVAAEQEAGRRVWWCVYSFEKLFAFELGRPSATADADHDQLDPSAARVGGDGDHVDFFHIVISLARTLSEVSKRSIAARTKEELAGGREGLENAIRFKVATTGELVLLLMQWAESLPKNLRPTSDLLCEPAEFPLAAFISVQYHSAMVMLLRNTLLISEEAIRAAVEEYAAGQSWSQVTRNGQAIVANSARSMVKMFMEGHDLGALPVLHTITAPLHALSVLSVHLIRHPTSRLATSDMSLIHNAGEFAIEKYERIAKDRRVHGVVELLDNEVMKIVSTARPKSMTRSSFSGTRPFSHMDDSPGGSHTAQRDSGLTMGRSPQVFSHSYGGQMPADLMDLSTAAMAVPMHMPGPDVVWSPALADEIGWDWGDFIQLFAEAPM